MKDMTTGSPAKVIVRFAVPLLLSFLLQLTYHIVDTRIVGTFLGDDALAAVGATTVLYSVFAGFFSGLGNGFGIITAMHFGAKDLNKVRISFLSAIIMGMGLVTLLVCIAECLMTGILSFLNVPEGLMHESLGYIRIVIAGMVVTMLYNILLASARAIGDSVTPLLTLVVSVCLNIAGDLVLIGIFGMGVKGAAIATVGAQIITLSVCAVYLYRRYEFFRLRKGDTKLLDKDMMKNMLLTGISMGLMSSLISIGSFILQTGINGFGNSYIVAQSTARRITDLLMSIFVAIGQAMSTYTGQNYGAGKYDRIRQGMKAGYAITCSWCVFVIVIVYTLAPLMITAITGSSDPVMIDAANRYLRFDSLLYVLVAVIFVLRHTLQGIGDKVTPLISSGIEMTGKVVLTYTLVPALGYNGVILVEPIVWIIMIIPLVVRIRKWQS